MIETLEFPWSLGVGIWTFGKNVSWSSLLLHLELEKRNRCAQVT